jgi:hypothetical protein
MKERVALDKKEQNRLEALGHVRKKTKCYGVFFLGKRCLAEFFYPQDFL